MYILFAILVYSLTNEPFAIYVPNSKSTLSRLEINLDFVTTLPPPTRLNSTRLNGNTTYASAGQDVPGDELSRDYNALFFVFKCTVKICFDGRMRSQGLFWELAHLRHQRA
jgi:hypothetical protein